MPKPLCTMRVEVRDKYGNIIGSKVINIWRTQEISTLKGFRCRLLKWAERTFPNFSSAEVFEVYSNAWPWYNTHQPITKAKHDYQENDFNQKEKDLSRKVWIRQDEGAFQGRHLLGAVHSRVPIRWANRVIFLSYTKQGEDAILPFLFISILPRPPSQSTLI